MPTALDQAMEQLQAEIDAFGLGTPGAPSGTTPSMEYFLSRAKVLGMSYLKRCKQMGLDSDLGAAERLQGSTSRLTKSDLVVPAPTPLAVLAQLDPTPVPPA